MDAGIVRTFPPFYRSKSVQIIGCTKVRTLNVFSSTSETYELKTRGLDQLFELCLNMITVYQKSEFRLWFSTVTEFRLGTDLNSGCEWDCQVWWIEHKKLGGYPNFHGECLLCCCENDKTIVGKWMNRIDGSDWWIWWFNPLRLFPWHIMYVQWKYGSSHNFSRSIKITRIF